MSVTRQANFSGQQRVDVPHLRGIESSICYDFDVLAGTVLGGSRALIVKGFNISIPGAIGNPASQLQVIVAGGVVLNVNSSEAGSVYQVPSTRAPEVLAPSNSKVTGGFISNQTNFVGLDLRRAADSTTADLVQFSDANSGLETPKTIPLARTLDYAIVISTTDFSSTPHITPIAAVTTDVNNNVTAIADARNLMHRLGAGGSNPKPYNAYPWPQGRREFTAGGSDVFSGGDKAIGSTKEWMDAVMTSVWDTKGGEFWYTPSSDRYNRLTRGPLVFTNGEQFEFDGTNLHWKNLRFVFGNGTAVYFNDIADQLTDSPGLTDLAEGECLYADLNYTLNATGGTAIVPLKVALANLGSPVVPGSRYIIAWRTNSQVYTRDGQFAVGTTFKVATNTSTGAVQLKQAAGVPALPIVLAQDINGAYTNTSSSGSAFFGTGHDTGAGFEGTGGATSGPGIKGTGGATNGKGGIFQGTGTGAGVMGTGGAGAGNVAGGSFFGGAGAGNSDGVQGQGHNGGAGGSFTGGATGAGVVGFAGALNMDGVVGIGGAGTGIGIHGFGGGGLGGYFETTGSATALKALGGGASGLAIDAIGGAPTGVTVGGNAVRGTGAAAVAAGSTPGIGGVFAGGADGNGLVGGGTGLTGTGGNSNAGANGGIGVKATGGTGDNGGPCLYLDTAGNTGPAIRTSGLSTAGRPTAPVDGDAYYDTTVKVWRYYNSDVVATVDPSDVTQTTGEWSMTKHLTRANGSVGNGDPVLKSIVSSGTPSYYIDSNRKVQLRGVVTLSNNGTIFVLPVGFRPASTLTFAVADTTTGTSSFFQASVSSVGAVSIPVGVVGGHVFDLSSISFASVAVIS